MADANAEGREVNARIVYWGIEGAGKESNLRSIHGKLRPDHRGRLDALPTALDPSVCSWRLPIELGEIAGVRTRIQVIAVPGGAEQAPTRKQLLDRVDGVVFVVDTRRERIEENVAALEELRSALGAYGRSLESTPLVIQYNQHGESDPFVLEELHRKLDVRGAAAFEARASDGTGVLPTLTTISKRVVRQLRENEQAARQPAAQPARSHGAPIEAQASGASAGDAARSLHGTSGAAQRATGERIPSAPQPSEAERARIPAANTIVREISMPSRMSQPRSDDASDPSVRSARVEAASIELAALVPNPRATAIFLEPEPDPNPMALDLEEAALEVDVELLDERDAAISRAQDLLDPSWSGVAEDFDAPLEVSEPLGPASLADGWHLRSAGRPTVVGAATLLVPIVIADDAGRELAFRLTVSLEPLLDES